jgi:hypothetical protein
MSHDIEGARLSDDEIKDIFANPSNVAAVGSPKTPEEHLNQFNEVRVIRQVTDLLSPQQTDELRADLESIHASRLRALARLGLYSLH